ncbi:hypothetical protein [Streptomyces sp. NBC_01506]|uniref:hypothetical protein n=1 Tax=Streptomyces sp. NBC_01506 TaxID=2903887 RepID=UPI0038640B97
MMRRAGLATLAVALSIGLSGCGEGAKKEYAIPTSLCGVSVDQELLEPLLPPGKKIEVRNDPYAKGVPRTACVARVDGDVWLTVYGEWREAGFTALQAAEDKVVGGGSFGTAENGKVYSWNRGAATAFPCRSEDWGAYSAAVEVVERDDREANVKALETFITPYGEALAKTLPCEDSA